jgi:hypothetical protein
LDENVNAIKENTEALIVIINEASVSQTGFGKRFRETKMHNDGRALLAVLNLYERIKIRVATFDTNRSVADSTHSINR